MRKKITVVLVALLMALSVMGGGMLFAMAEDFSAGIDNGNEGAAYPMGRSASEITTALNKKVKDLNVEIAKVTAGLTEVAEITSALTEAYGNGVIPGYSRRNNGLITQENKRSDFKTWEGVPVVDLKYLNAGYEPDWIGGDTSMGWLMYNGISNKGVLVAGKFAKGFGGSQKIGVAVADRFRVYDNGVSGAYTDYQNFSNAYLKSVDGADCTIVLRKNISLKAGVESGTTQADFIEEVNANTNAAGYVGAATKKVIDASGIESAQLSELFVKAYENYAQASINVGYTFGIVNNNFGMVCQNFRHGDSSASPWDSDTVNGDRARWSVLAYNAELNEVFLVKDEFFYAFENGGDLQNNARSLGAPNGEEFVYGGNRYQNFVGGYIKANGTTALNANAAEVVKGKKIDGAGVVTDIDLKDKVGYISNGVTIPEGFTKETLKAAFVAMYEENLADFALAGLTVVENRNNVIMQVYTDADNVKEALGYDKVNKVIRYLSTGAYNAFNESAGLGCPTTDSFKVAEGSDNLPAVYAQSFENGYIKIKITTQVDLDDEGNVITFTKEIGTVTVGATYDAAKGTFTTTNYVDSINRVNSDVAGALDKLEIPANEELLTLFKKAYSDAFAIGFSAGIPSDSGIQWWTTGNSGVIKLTLKGGNGNANFWNDNTLMTYDCNNRVVRITTGAIANIYANDGASGNGWATTEMMINTKTGTIVQQFNVTDTVVTDRKVYIIVPDGDSSKASKVPGEYDFEANKNEGEWVNYLSQFGGDSISSKPVTVKTDYKVNEDISINFADFISNPSVYGVKFELGANSAGSVDTNGVFTYKPDSKGSKEIEVVAYTAFDKVTLKLTINVTENATKKGCSTVGFGGGDIFGGMTLLLILGGAALLLGKRGKVQA